MRSDPDLGKLLRADLDASAAHGGTNYDVEKGVARHLALIAGVGAAAAATTAATTATASTSSVASAAAAASTAPAAAAAAATTTGIAATLGVKTMIAIAAIGVVSATGGVIAVTRRSPDPEPKPAVVTTAQPRSNSQDLVASPPRAANEGTTTTLETAPTITTEDLPLSLDGVKPTVPGNGIAVAPAVSATKIETDNYAKARALAATDPAAALAIVEADNKKFAHGVFAEEREALAIDCLVRTGRKAEAQERGKAFLAAHPTSTFAEKIRGQIDSR